jgi:hypothetical protein
VFVLSCVSSLRHRPSMDCAHSAARNRRGCLGEFGSRAKHLLFLCYIISAIRKRPAFVFLGPRNGQTGINAILSHTSDSIGFVTALLLAWVGDWRLEIVRVGFASGCSDRGCLGEFGSRSSLGCPVRAFDVVSFLPELQQGLLSPRPHLARASTRSPLRK